LSAAALHGHLDVARYLIDELGANVNHTTENGATPLYLAASAGHLDVVLYLAKEHAVDVNQSDKYGSSPLHAAALNGHLDVVRCLIIELGADIHHRREDGRRALSVAANAGHTRVVMSLVTAHIDEFTVLFKEYIETTVIQLALSVCVVVSKVADNIVVVALGFLLATFVAILFGAYWTLRRQHHEACNALQQQQEMAADTLQKQKEAAIFALEQQKEVAEQQQRKATRELKAALEQCPGEVECKICLSSREQYVSFSCGMQPSHLAPA
jgi:hypothetical protein